MKKDATQLSLIKTKEQAIPSGVSYVQDLLYLAVQSSDDKGCVFLSKTGQSFLSYKALYEKAVAISNTIESKISNRYVMLEIEDKEIFILALWTCFLSNAIPVLSTLPITYSSDEQNFKQFENIYRLLDDPIVFLDSDAQVKMSVQETQYHSICFESLMQVAKVTDTPQNSLLKNPHDVALVIFTSGSTGLPKGVQLTHENIVNASYSKIEMLNMSPSDKTFNWVAMSHVAGTVDFHLRDLACICSQYHAPTAMIIENPLTWMDIISQKQITISFAPNFALGLIGNTVKNLDGLWDLSSLRHLIIGGELVIPRTLDHFISTQGKYKFAPSCITPGFGMTETCAGSIFSKQVNLDSKHNVSNTSLGRPVNGLSLRIIDDHGDLVKHGTVGNLQLQGKQVTLGYLKNDAANSKSFTHDGWFETGDIGYLSEGYLFLTGRQKDTIIINGVNHDCHEIESIIDNLADVETSYSAVFSLVSERKDTESLVVVFSPKEKSQLVSLIIKMKRMLSHTFNLSADYFIPLDKHLIEKTSLGKIKHQKLKENFLNSHYKKEIKFVEDILYGKAEYIQPKNSIEESIQKIWHDILAIPKDKISCHSSFIELGGDSLQLIQLEFLIEKKFNQKLSSATLFQFPTIQKLALYLNEDNSTEYHALVPFNPYGKEPIIFFVPPLLGEALIFYELSKHIDNKMFAFQARGLRPDEQAFDTVVETADHYIKQIQRLQPTGPYFLAGYSYGGLVMFEMIKQLEASGHSVKVAFNLDMGAINNISSKEKGKALLEIQDTFDLAILVDALKLINFGKVNPLDSNLLSNELLTFAHKLKSVPPSMRLKYLLKNSDKDKVQRLSLNESKLACYAEVSRKAFQGLRDYEFKKSNVINAKMHIFYTGTSPRIDVLQWEQLNLVAHKPHYIQAKGDHFTMLDRHLVAKIANEINNIMTQV